MQWLRKVDNDTSTILGNVLLSAGNGTVSTNYRLNGYRLGDLTMDGITIFAESITMWTYS